MDTSRSRTGHSKTRRGRRRRTLVPVLAATAVRAALLVSGDAPSSPCERLPAELVYSQAEAPADVSAILRLVHDRINRDVVDVMKVEVKWSGAELHRRVGERAVQCEVTRLTPGDGDEGGGRRTVTQCFEVPFSILDVDECAVPSDHPMVHRCRPPAVCVNTEGSYECACPAEQSGAAAAAGRTAWELALGSAAASSCPGTAATGGCCDEDGHSAEGRECRASFRCPVNPCGGSDDDDDGDGDGKRRGNAGKGGHGAGSAAAAAACAPAATCVRAASPLARPDHECRCPPGLLGNGRPCPRRAGRVAPKVGFDGAPTAETRRALAEGRICGCVAATTDACDGFPKCPKKHETCTVEPSTNKPRCDCRDGYFRHPTYGCVDESPPVLHLRDHERPAPSRGGGSARTTGVTRLSQGDHYREPGVDVQDDNAEEYLRSLKIDYSRPLPRGCLLEVGEFVVNYTVATPWTTPEFVRATRRVVIGNVNECRLSATSGIGADCPGLVARCDTGAGAACMDEVGTYRCACPDGTTGDGFLLIPRLTPDGRGGYAGGVVPQGYAGGNGCRDTRPPALELRGPNPKMFRVARSSGVRGVLPVEEDEGQRARAEGLAVTQRGAYESDIRAMIQATSGAELCATATSNTVRPTDCVRAMDHTHNGVLDLTSRVIVGDPVANPDDPLRWKVPYDVTDDAGNKAATVWRAVVVEEVDINQLAQTGPKDRGERRRDVDRAVAAALAEERKRSKSHSEPRECPPCRASECTEKERRVGSGTMSAAECNAACERKMNKAASTVPANEAFCATSELKRLPAGLELVQDSLVFLEERLGPSVTVLCLAGCALAGLYALLCAITALFCVSRGPYVRDYYHTHEDIELERRMKQNVTYLRSPTAASPGTAPPSTAPASQRSRPSPAASLGMHGGGIFSSSGTNTTAPSPSFTSSNATDSVYSPITPSRQQASGSMPGPSSTFSGSNVADNIFSPITPSRRRVNGATPESLSVGSRGSNGVHSSSPYEKSPYEKY